MNATGASYSPPQSATRSFYNSNGNDFQFAFPKFGDLPGSFLNNGSMAKTTSPTTLGPHSLSASNPSVQGAVRTTSSGSVNTPSLVTRNGLVASPQAYQAPANGLDSTNFGDLSGLFSPSILHYASGNNSADYISYPTTTNTSLNSMPVHGSIASVNGHAYTKNGRQNSSASITGSPASSMSHALDSSCGTTPESFADSPDTRKSSEGAPSAGKNEVKSPDKSGGKEHLCKELAETRGNTIDLAPPIHIKSNSPLVNTNTVRSPFADINGIDWLAQQNGGQFDPVLFGDYRDPQDNILNNNPFGDYFNDAFPTQDIPDFSSAYNAANAATIKQDLMEQVEKQKEGSPLETTASDETRKFIPCDKIWSVHIQLLQCCLSS